MTIFFDIETLPCNNESVIAELEKTIAPPGNIKKAESIKAWMDENKEAALLDLIANTSFDGLYGRIACIAWCSDDGEILSTTPDNSEAEAIEMYYEYLSFSQDSYFCGHKIHSFDLPFLKHRSIILDIEPPNALWKAMKAKPWDDCIKDTLLMWSNDKWKKGSMDRLCKALGIAGKGDFDGSMVADEWEKGSKEKVISYCCEDVSRTRQIYKRLTFQQDSAA
jgi:predicted PolB exonuclease-like 3'-5' exonuclease